MLKFFMLKIILGIAFLFLGPVSHPCLADEGQKIQAAIVLKIQPQTLTRDQFENKELDLESGAVISPLMQQGFISENLQINTQYAKEFRSSLRGIMASYRYTDQQFDWIQSELDRSQNSALLSICLKYISSPVEKGEAFCNGGRVVNALVPFNNRKTILGWHDEAYIKKHSVSMLYVRLDHEVYSYAATGSGVGVKQQNGMFSLYPQRSDPATYTLKGVFYADGAVFVINENLPPGEEKTIYSNDSSKENNIPVVNEYGTREITIIEDGCFYLNPEEFKSFRDEAGTASSPIVESIKKSGLEEWRQKEIMVDYYGIVLSSEEKSYFFHTTYKDFF
jgi:hypothetical protein